MLWTRVPPNGGARVFAFSGAEIAIGAIEKSKPGRKEDRASSRFNVGAKRAE